MKEIIIIVRPEKLEDIKHILDEVNCGGMTLSTVMGCGTQKGMVEEQGTRELKGFQTTINLLPKKDVEPVLDYMLSEDFTPYKMGIEGRQIYLAYRIHLSDLTEASEDEIRRNLVNLALRADEMDNKMVERFGCEFSEYSRKDKN